MNTKHKTLLGLILIVLIIIGAAYVESLVPDHSARTSYRYERKELLEDGTPLYKFTVTAHKDK
jgi:hypothetical protein